MCKLTPLSDTLAVEDPAPKNELDGSQRPKKSRAPQKKSNINAQHARLDAFLNGGGFPGGETGLTSSSSGDGEAVVSIDVLLNETLTNPPKPKLDIIFPLPLSSDKKVSGRIREPPGFGTVSIEIEVNGRIVVSSATGLPFTDSETLGKLATVLSLGEDLGVLVQWILGRLRAG
jgi:hypothetical protein